MAERDRLRCVEHDRPAQRRPPRRWPRAVDGEREQHQRAGGDEVRGGRVEAAVWDSRMMRSPRFIDSESSVASEPLATVSTTAATDSPIPTQTRPLSRSPSSALAASAPKIGDEVLMIAGVERGDPSRRRRGSRAVRAASGALAGATASSSSAARTARAALCMSGESSSRASLPSGSLPRGSQMGRPCRTGEGQQGRTPPSGAYFFFFLAAFFFFTDSPPSRRMLSAC